MTEIKPRIHIIGAGFSGLSVAYLLGKLNKFDISIFDFVQTANRIFKIFLTQFQKMLLLKLEYCLKITL